MDRTLTIVIFTVIALLAAALIIGFVIQQTKGYNTTKIDISDDERGIAGTACADSSLVCATVEGELQTVRRCDLVEGSALICEHACPCGP